MGEVIEIETERLILRQWREDDKNLFAKLNADPKVMQYYPDVLSAEQSNELASKCLDLVAKNGWGFWALETISDNRFIGFTGLNQPDYELPVDSCVEIGWRLSSDVWGHGFATEAAKACLNFAFENLVLDEVYAFSSVANQRSRAVMERLHMINLNTNFNHPLLAGHDELQEHVLYKIELQQWRDVKQ
ncbi:Acetyltransferase, GNAT family [hydrothermal vent metagenome]|uniref:Acetyltransferase, GNAT family n=1 Tax=hydrothermal vent metagenome TaxID=652676 RepID=A0A3B0YPT1_9ZZZZ